MQLHVIAATFKAKMEKKELSVCQRPSWWLSREAAGRTGRRTCVFGGGAGRRMVDPRLGSPPARICAGWRRAGGSGRGLDGAKEGDDLHVCKCYFFNFYICPYMWVPLVGFFLKTSKEFLGEGVTARKPIPFTSCALHVHGFCLKPDIKPFCDLSCTYLHLV
jgi:hypothetical protein